MRIHLAKHISMAETEFGAVVLNEANGRYWQLNEAGADVLGALLRGEAEVDAARLIGGGDLLPIEDAIRDVGLLVASLRAADLLSS